MATTRVMRPSYGQAVPMVDPRQAAIRATAPGPADALGAADVGAIALGHAAAARAACLLSRLTISAVPPRTG